MSSVWSGIRTPFALLLLIAAVGFACSDDATGTTDPEPEPTPDPDPGVVEVQLTQSLTFSDDDVTIEPGTTVRWVNQYDIYHTVTPRDSEQEGVWTRQEMNEGDTFEHTFEVSGQTYEYYCEPHEGDGMTGTITVE